ncbi:MAG: RNA polymerase sigma factor [Myxococcota bacterium]|nr:RNA polymerase sigma factor [Myxococcota bacterium]
MGLDVEALYRKYGDMVLGRCRTLLGRESEAQEACQEVFLRLHRYRHSFREEASPSTFLYRATTNHCLNLLRRRRRRPEDSVYDLGHVADSVLDIVEIRQLLDHLLEGQDDRTMSCIVYHYVDGMTQAETGELLGISAAAVRKRLAKFRREVATREPAWMKREEEE